MKEELEKNLKYQDYLDNVVQSMSKFFPEISDILNRYKTLRDANEYLIEKHHQDEKAHSDMQKDFSNYTKSMQNRILNDSNEIAEMQVGLEHSKVKSNIVQREVDKLNMDASEKGLELGKFTIEDTSSRKITNSYIPFRCTGEILSGVSNILERAEQSFRVRHNKPQIERVHDKMQNMELMEKYLRTVSKLKEVELFMVSYRDIVTDYEKMQRGDSSGNNASTDDTETAKNIHSNTGSVTETTKK